MNIAAIHKITERVKKLQREKMCLAPSDDCEGIIIRAHTMSESLMLRPIARDGHVYTWRFTFKPTQGIHDKIKFEECGVNETSIFLGFFQKHDRALFACIETEKFVCSSKQLAMLYFRAVAKEYYAKLKQLESIVRPDELREVHGLEPDSELPMGPDMALYETSSLTAVAEIHELKERLDRIMLTGDYRRVVSQVFEIEGGFPVVCAGLTNPDFDFGGNLIQDLSNLSNKVEAISLSVVPQERSSFVIISYLDIHALSAEKLIKSLLGRADIPADLIWMTFCHFENSAYSPNWIDSLPPGVRAELERAMFSNINLFDPAFSILADRKVQMPGFRVAHSFRI